MSQMILSWSMGYEALCRVHLTKLGVNSIQRCDCVDTEWNMAFLVRSIYVSVDLI